MIRHFFLVLDFHQLLLASLCWRTQTPFFTTQHSIARPANRQRLTIHASPAVFCRVFPIAASDFPQCARWRERTPSRSSGGGPLAAARSAPCSQPLCAALVCAPVPSRRKRANHRSAAPQPGRWISGRIQLNCRNRKDVDERMSCGSEPRRGLTSACPARGYALPPRQRGGAKARRRRRRSGSSRGTRRCRRAALATRAASHRRRSRGSSPRNPTPPRRRNRMPRWQRRS